MHERSKINVILYYFVFPGASVFRQAGLRARTPVFCVLLQSEKLEGGVHLSSRGTEGTSEGTGKTHFF